MTADTLATVGTLTIFLGFIFLIIYPPFGWLLLLVSAIIIYLFTREVDPRRRRRR